MSGVLWLIGVLAELEIIALPNNLGFWALAVAGFLLILGSLLDGL